MMSGIISTDILNNVPALLVTAGNVVKPVWRFNVTIVSEKRCAKCGEVKDASQFYVNKRKPDGLEYSCKECKKAYRHNSDYYTIDVHPRIDKPVYLTCVDCGVPKATRRARSRPYCPACGKARNSGIFPVDGKKQCTKCGEIKSVSDFPSRTEKDTGRYRGYCKDCDNVRTRRWRANNTEKDRERSRKHYYKNHTQERESSREERRQLRLEVLTAYGGKCACCGENVFEFLSIDHINGDGARDRKVNPNTYLYLKKNNFPEGYRVLCHNCNQALGHYGYCPHNNLENNSQPLWWQKKEIQ